QPGESLPEICFQPSALLDGRWANNAWLQELPDPVTKIAWDNPARISPALARKHGLANGDVVHIKAGDREITLPVWIIPGQADESITLELGYGRTRAGRVGDGVGFDVGSLRLSGGMGFYSGVSLRSAGGRHVIACAQEFDGMVERPLVREAGLKEFQGDPHFARHDSEIAAKNLWKEHTYDAGFQWGMVIDLTACIGCNACTIACQSENNIPVVGKEQVAMGREMHWIRLDRYFKGGEENPEMVYQPVACQHCENAPCEQVCPVAATVHDHEGLNVMAYNRCVGTRYCSNNCPYKARRFNFFDYTGRMDELKKMAQNPDVTVRMRGVMEKCTYCLQRLNLAKNRARLEGRPLVDGEVMTACQQACPTGAISFGNLLDDSSRVAIARAWARSYALLGELNVRPRTLYAAKIRNRNPELS
ncbi:MAG TPA: 4Fe-4S dicluster domain-containing protein, partial [bacterium]|nr:4Fe-4S dicluster domain-containing protein [bacterium]